MSKIKRKLIYLKAAAVLIGYTILSRIIFYKAVLWDNPVLSFVLPMLYGMVFAIVFLYIFSHEDFFKFAKAIEEKEKKAEKKWLRRFKHFGKAFTTLAVGTVAGPIFSALTARLLLRRAKYRYWLVVAANIPSTLLHVGLAKGVVSLIL